MTFRAACLIVLTCLAGCASAPYQTVTRDIATVTDSAGVPSVMRNNQPYLLAKQSRLYIGDIIVTDGQSSATLQLISGHTVSVPPKSQWLIIGVTSNGIDYRSNTSLAQGALLVQGPGESQHKFTVRTAIATLYTLADNFWLGYHQGDIKGLTVVAMDNTAMTISNPDGSTRLIAPLQTTTVSPGGAPQRTIEWSSQKLQNTIDYYNRRE